MKFILAPTVVIALFVVTKLQHNYKRIQWKLFKTKYKEPRNQFLLSDVFLSGFTSSWYMYTSRANQIMLTNWFVLSTRTRTHACTHARTQARTHACTHTCTHARTHAHTYTHTDTLTHACTHTHVHTHTQTHS